MRIVRYSYPTYRSFTNLPGFGRSPWSGLDGEINRLFSTVATGLSGNGQFPVDLYEDKENTYVRAELPGVNRGDIQVEMADEALTLTATRKRPATEGQAEESQTFTRVVTIPQEVQADKVAATYENGVLTVTLPKREEAKPRKITVAVK
jgi:HSP20 family protein